VITPPRLPEICIEVPKSKPYQVIAPPTVVAPEPNIRLPPPPKFCPPTAAVTAPVVTPTLPVIPKPAQPVYNIPTLQTNKFLIQFQWACRQGVAFESCQGIVLFNDQIILSINPTNYAVKTENLIVFVQQGQNKLQFEGAGVSDSFGLTIDNVRFVRDGTVLNLAVNGGFEAPDTYGSWGIFNDIPGWQGQQIEIGEGIIYNSGWGNFNQVAELDSHQNYIITQYYNFDSLFYLTSTTFPADCKEVVAGAKLHYKLEFDWSARTEGVSSLLTSQGNVLWNNVVVGTLVPTTAGIQHASINVVV